MITNSKLKKIGFIKEDAGGWVYINCDYKIKPHGYSRKECVYMTTDKNNVWWIGNCGMTLFCGEIDDIKNLKLVLKLIGIIKP